MAKTESFSASDNMDTDAWLDHGDYSGGTFFDLDWKKQKEYRIWLHTKADIRALWRVVWKYLDDEGKLRITRWNSMEAPATLAKFNFKNDDGSREHSPQRDPFAKLIEWVDMQMVAGKIGYVDEIFKWEPEDAEEETILAGGFTGDFQSKDTKEDPEKKKIIRKAGVRLDEAYKHNCNAQEETVFIVCDNSNPGVGAQIATVGRGVSRAFQTYVADRKRVFPEAEKWKADPRKNPVCFSWARDESGPIPKYSVVATEDPLTDAIKAAISEAPPDTRKLFELSNVAVLFKQMKEYWCHEVVPPWDEIFGAAFEAVKGTPAAELPGDFNPENHEDDEDEEEDETKAVPPKTASASKPAPQEPPPRDASSEARIGSGAVVTSQEETRKEESDAQAAGDDAVHCEVCDGVMTDEVLASNPVICTSCGAKYVEDPADPTNLVLEKKAPEPPKVEAPPKREIKASRRPQTH